MECLGDLSYGAPLRGDMMMTSTTHQHKGMITMTTYTSATLAEKIIGACDKGATRELRKFLRAITPKADQPGKGGRWALEYNAKEIAALKKNFAKWNAQEEAAKAARIAAKADAARITAEALESDIVEEFDKGAGTPESPEAPDIDAMLVELDNEPEELIED